MKRLFTLLIGALSLYSSEAFAQFTTGLQTATSIISQTAPGLIGWNNPLFALLNDGSKTSSTALLLGDDTEYLMLTGFNINVPVGMIIKGIEVEVVKSGSNGFSYSVTDHDVRIIKNGVITGNDMSLSGKWPSADQTFTYGSATDNWGTTWTAADVNSANFGIAISAHLGGLLLSTARVNGVSINVSYDNAPLPVTMVSFDAKAVQGKVDLSWVTATEINNQGFTIQKSVDGIQWNNIGEVLSHSTNSASFNWYNYTDYNTFAGTTYYRLKQSDVDGTITYTAMITASTTTMDVALYPNPANEMIHVVYGGEEKIQSVVLSDLMGKEIQTYNSLEPAQELQISTASLIPGEYLISMASGKEVIYKKVMVVH